jgi:hypothetical protein
MSISEEYIFIVDTDSYSGNFEREMIAYATGLHCVRGQAETQNFHDTVGEEKTFAIGDYAIKTRDSNDDDRRPEYAHIEPTPGYYNNGMGFNYREGEEAKAVQAYKDSCYKEIERLKAIYSDKPEVGIEASLVWDERAGECSYETLGRFPAYMSISLSFSDFPPIVLLDLMKQRCREYAALPDANTQTVITITGFRLLKRTTTVIDSLVMSAER